MQSVPINEPFHYEAWPLILAVTIMVALIVVIVILMIASRPQKAPVVQKVQINKAEVKAKYLAKLQQIENRVNGGNVAHRRAYQELSIAIRSFVFEISGIDVRKYTLSDFDNLKLNQSLKALITEYYEPEFAKNSQGDILGSIQKTKQVIQAWR